MENNIKNPVKFGEGQPTGNGGRPPKLFNSLVQDLQTEGYNILKPSQILELYSILLGLDFDKLTTLKNDIAQPQIVRTICSLLTAKNNDLQTFAVIEKMLDRVAKNSTIEGGKQNPIINLIETPRPKINIVIDPNLKSITND
jgi:hypothetical protein